ncbi:UDP-glucosyltransferase, putative [Ricinus communis]|uniref:anthocyanidin 3-O-glucosyltransferase n=1 Tax=Ricinus communis TaxID=3988 RepID=B9SGI2_RICCO|nr:UDP-glucosyltransferase, putative [Ricinus communis]
MLDVLDLNNQMCVEYIRMGVEIQTADGILVNTWHDLEPKTLFALGDEMKLGWVSQVPVYPVGPLVRPANATLRSKVFDWLDMLSEKSVIYVSFGSGGTLSAKQTMEMVGDWTATVFKTGHRSDDTPDFLPDGFLTRTKRMGMVVPTWAPQTEILNHPAVGGFLSHSGWNSTLESIVSGLPMIAWPLYAEQRINAAMLTEDNGVAVQSKAKPLREVVSRDEIETMIREIMELKGGARRARLETLKLSAEKALRNGGLSHNSLAQVANDCKIKVLRNRTHEHDHLL